MYPTMANPGQQQAITMQQWLAQRQGGAAPDPNAALAFGDAGVEQAQPPQAMQATPAVGSQLGGTAAQILLAQRQLELADKLQQAGYVPNSGGLGAAAQIFSAWKGTKLKRKAGESMAEAVQRKLEEETKAELAKEERRATAEAAQHARDREEKLADAAREARKPQWDSTRGGYFIPPSFDEMQGGQAPQQGAAPQAGGIPDEVMAAVIQQESRGNPNAVSPKGAQGLAQLMPKTQRDPGFGVKPLQNNSPEENVRFGRDYLGAMMTKYSNNLPLALAAYNGGHATLDKALAKAGGDPQRALSMMPAETQAYVPAIMGRLSGGGYGGGGAPQGGGRFVQVAPPVADKPGELEKKIAILKARGVPEDQITQMILGGQQGGAVPTIGDPNKTGNDFLATLKPNEAAQVRALAEGRMQFPSGTALKSPHWQAMLGAVSQFDPEFDAVNYNARSKTRNDFTSGVSSKSVNALNTVIGHVGTLAQKAEALHNFDTPALNTAWNYAATQLGSGGPKGFQTGVEAVASELVRAYRGVGGNEADIQGWKAQLDSSNSPEQTKEIFATIAEQLHSKLSALEETYKAGMGTAAGGKIKLLTPASEAALNKMMKAGGREPYGEPAKPAAPPAAKSAAPSRAEIDAALARNPPR